MKDDVTKDEGTKDKWILRHYMHTTVTREGETGACTAKGDKGS